MKYIDNTVLTGEASRVGSDWATCNATMSMLLCSVTAVQTDAVLSVSAKQVETVLFSHIFNVLPQLLLLASLFLLVVWCWHSKSSREIWVFKKKNDFPVASIVPQVLSTLN